MSRLELIAGAANVLEQTGAKALKTFRSELPEIFGGAKTAVKSAGDDAVSTLERAVPSAGDQIYIPSRGSDMSPHLDRIGGLATVSKVETGISAGKEVPFVSVKEAPGMKYNWEFLAAEQQRLQVQHGIGRAKATPRLLVDDGFKK